MKSITDEIYSVMVKEQRAFTNAQILQEFFKIDFENSQVARKIVEPLLKVDARFRQTPAQTWVAVKRIPVEALPLEETPFVLFYIEDLEKMRRPRGIPAGDLFSLIKQYSSFLLYKGSTLEYDFDIKGALKNLGQYIFVPYDRKSMSALRRLYRVISPLAPDIKTLSVSSIISEFYPQKKLKTWDDIIREFGLRNVHSESPSSRTKTLMYILEKFLDTARERGISSVGGIMDRVRESKKQVDFSKYDFDRDFLRDIPEMPGVYLFFDSGGRILYVGKTGNLKVRVNSYFWDTGESVEKIKGILQELSRIEYRVLGSDLEALLEEHRLIDEHRPNFNKMVNIPKREVSVADTLLVLPSKMEGYLKLYLLSERLPLIDYDFDCAGDNERFFSILKRLEEAQGSVFDPLKIIALFYLRRYEERLNRVDLDRFATPGDVVNALRMHCANQEDMLRERSMYI